MSTRDVLPSNPDMEMAVLGCALLDETWAYELVRQVPATAFYDKRNRLIYEATAEITARGGAVDLNTVAEALRRKGQLDEIGGAVYITDCLDRPSAPAMFLEYLTPVRECAGYREIITGLEVALHQAKSDGTRPPRETIDEIAATMLKVQEQISLVTAHRSSLEDQIDHFIAQVRAQWDRESIYRTHLHVLDARGFIEPETLIAVGGWPSHGKSVLAWQLVLTLLEQGVPCAVFSTEMSASRYIRRGCCYYAGLDNRLFRWSRAGMSPQDEMRLPDYERAMAAFRARTKEAPLCIVDGEFGVVDVRATIRKLKAEHSSDFAFVVIDAFQDLVTTPKRGSDRRHELDEWLVRLNEIVRTTGVCMLICSHLLKRPEVQRRPVENDLKETGMLAHKADKVAFVHYPFKWEPVPEKLHGLEVQIAKDKDGAMSPWKTLYFRPEMHRLFNTETEHAEWLGPAQQDLVDGGEDGDVPF